jgi:hypothetical protein
MTQETADTSVGKTAASFLRSIGAMFAGFVAIVVLSIGTDLALEKTVFPALASAKAPDALLALALTYRTAYGALGSWIAARLAPGRPMVHAIALGLIGWLLATIGVIAQWKLGAHWYPLALALLTLPAAWLGGWLAKMKSAPAAA